MYPADHYFIFVQKVDLKKTFLNDIYKNLSKTQTHSEYT